MRRFYTMLVVGLFFIFWGVVWAQVGGSPPETPPEEEPDIDPYKEMTLNLSGGGCEINLNEAELLRVKGILEVDIEKKPGKVVVWYDPTVTNKGLIKSAVGKKKGGCAANEEAAP